MTASRTGKLFAGGKRLTGLGEDRRLAKRCLIAAQDDITVERIKLEQPSLAAAMLGRDQRGSRAAKTIEHDLALIRLREHETV